MNSAIIFLPIEQTSKPKVTVDQILRFTRTAVESGAVILSEVITISLLATLNAGVSTRYWWESDGKDLAKEIAWTTPRTLMMIVLGLACLIHVLGFSLQLHWKAAKSIWAWINRATNDGLGLYGPSPMLKNWLIWWSRPTDIEINCDVPELELTGDEVLAWAKARWPEQLGAH